MSDYVIQLDQVGAGYGKVPVLHEISIRIARAKLTVVLGPNGSGKSTLLRSIAGIVRVSHGSVTLEGRNVTNRSVHDLVKMGVLFQPESRELFRTMTIEENLTAAQTPARQNGSQRIDRVFEAFPFLATNRNRRVAGLSGGEQQMVAIGRAIMAAPTVLLLDEPSLGLAPVVLQEMYTQLMTLQRELGLTILLAEQGARVALENADYIYILSQGQIVRHGTRDEMSDAEVLDAYFGARELGANERN